MSHLFPYASTTELGVVQVGSNINVDANSVISIPQSVATNATVTFTEVDATTIKQNGSTVISSVTPTAGTGISLTSVTTSGPAAAFTVNNTGVTKIVAGTNISISPAGGTGDVTITASSSGLITVAATAVAYTALATDEYIGVTVNPTTVTLPTGIAGKSYIIKNETTGSTTVTGTGGQLLDSSLTKVLGANASITVVFRGTAWHLI